MKRVAVGLSGGVDSAVSAALLKEQGYEVTGVFIICYHGPGCRTDEDRKDALDVALKLDIPFEVLDFRQAYQEKVLEYFKSEYAGGRTPNPDIVCNREIKFGLFYDWVLEKGFDFVATGHYAQIGRGYQLQRAKDAHKDQTYFLYQLREEQLKHILFPIGGLIKDEVRAEALKRELPVAKKPDSQGICFVGEVPVREFLKKMGIKENMGEVIDTVGRVTGKHRGVWFYTIGQRHGFDIRVKNSQSPVYYVVGKNIQNNQLIVGTREQCMREELEVGEVHWINGQSIKRLSDQAIKVRIRHGGELIGSKVTAHGSLLTVHLNNPVFGVAPGQSVVFYDGEVCLGGGIID